MPCEPRGDYKIFFFFLFAKDNVWNYFFFPFLLDILRETSFSDATSTGIETWLKSFFSSLIQHFQIDSEVGKSWSASVDVYKTCWYSFSVNVCVCDPHGECRCILCWSLLNFRIFAYLLYSPICGRRRKKSLPNVLVWFGINQSVSLTVVAAKIQSQILRFLADSRSSRLFLNNCYWCLQKSPTSTCHLCWRLFDRR